MLVQELHTHVLDNGITILADVQPSADSAGVGVFVRSGARDEPEELAGISHFIEHLLFKGTRTRSSLELTYAMADLGVQANAFTSEEETLYYGALVPERLAGMLELLADMLHPSFPPEEIELERKVILEEIAQYDDRPQSYLLERALKDFFGVHPAGNSVLGRRETIEGIGRKTLQSFFERRYVASNLFVAAAGRLNWDVFLADCARLFGGIPRGEDARRLEQFNYSPLSRIYRRKNLHQGHVLFLAPAPAAEDDDRYAALVLSVVLGDSTGSKLYWELVETGLAETASMETDERQGTGCVSIYCVSDVDSAYEVAESVENLMSRALDFTEEDLVRAKKKLAVRVAQHNEVPMGRLLTLGGDYLFNNRIIPVREHLAKIQEVTVNDISSVLGRFPLQNLSRFMLLPE